MFKTDVKVCANCGKKNPVLYKKCRTCDEWLGKVKSVPKVDENSIVFKRMERLVAIRNDLDFAVNTMNVIPEDVISFVDKFRFLYLLVDMVKDGCDTCAEFLELLVLEGKAIQGLLPVDHQRSQQMLLRIPEIQEHLAVFEQAQAQAHPHNDIHTVQSLVYNFGIHQQLPHFHHPDDDWEAVPDNVLNQYEEDGPATDDQLKLLVVVPDEHVSADPEDKCAICMEQYKTATMVKLPCGHLYHSICIMEWLKKNNKCPLGRCPIVSLQQLLDDKIKEVKELSE
jgi:hypothetical protein